eukprot:2869953-Amphidinium_carterae.1
MDVTTLRNGLETPSQYICVCAFAFVSGFGDLGSTSRLPSEALRVRCAVSMQIVDEFAKQHDALLLLWQQPPQAIATKLSPTSLPDQHFCECVKE